MCKDLNNDTLGEFVYSNNESHERYKRSLGLPVIWHSRVWMLDIFPQFSLEEGRRIFRHVQVKMRWGM